MQKTRLSTKGQVILPKNIRISKRWNPGTELTVEETKEGVLLKPARLFPETKLEDVVGMLKYKGKPKTIEEMDEAIGQAVIEEYARGRY